MDKRQKLSLKFTGERLIPKINKGGAIFYEHIARYLFASQLTKNKVVLDAACGSGYGSYILSKYGKSKEVYSFDCSKESIDYAKNNYGLKNIFFIQDNIENLRTYFENIIDIAVGFEIIEHLKNQKHFLVQVKKSLKPNGLFFISTPNKYTYPAGNPFHTKELSPSQFYKLLNQFFKYIRIYYQYFELAQLIKPKTNADFVLEEKFSKINQLVYSTTTSYIKNSQFIMAICSDRPIPELKNVIITSNKVDNIDLTKGLSHLTTQISNLDLIKSELDEIKLRFSKEKTTFENQIKDLIAERVDLQNQIKNRTEILENIKSAKFFKVWQLYCRNRDLILQKLKALKIFIL